MAPRRECSRARIAFYLLALAAGLCMQATVSARPPARDEAKAVLSDASARRFLVRMIEEKVHGEWGKAWTSLHPFYQRVVSRDVYVRCETQTPFSAPLESLRVIDVHPAIARIPGMPRSVAVVALTVVVKLRWFGPRDPIVFRHTFHLLPVRGHWTWLLSASEYRLYARGGCGVVPPTAATGGPI